MNLRPLILVPALVTAACLRGNAHPATPTSADAAQQSSSRTDISRLEDHPLVTVPSTPVTPRFVLEHRSALNGKTVKVKGTVIRVVGRADSGNPPPGGTTPLPGANPQPRVFLAESPVKAHDIYELMVLLREGDDRYRAGQTVEIEGIVESGPGAVILRHRYGQE
jgi:hypothetical protein